MLEKVHVDIIEAGFAIASPGDFDASFAVAKLLKEATVCSLTHPIKGDIERAGEAIKPANSGRIHTFIATSFIQMKYKLHVEPEQVLAQTVMVVKLARQFTDNIEFSLEGASRSEIDFMCRVIEAAIDAGATIINIPDTVGYAEPSQYGLLFRRLIDGVPNSDKAIFSAYCHNDLGLAVANSLSALMYGARQVECTINGLGERAGNAALEEIVMAVGTRKDIIPVEIGVDTRYIVPISRLVSTVTSFPVQTNKAIVGINAFAHESGIHQDGILKHRETYEILRAEEVGWNANKLVLGKHSGRAAVKARFEALGITFPDVATLNTTFVKLKSLADRKHEIFDEDLHALLIDGQHHAQDESYQLGKMENISKTGQLPYAQIELKIFGVTKISEAWGSGPVDATFKAIENLVNSGAHLQLYSVNAMTQGTDSQGEVTVRLERDAVIVNGVGVDTDIVTASAKAYLHALNLLVVLSPKSRSQRDGV